MKNQRIEYTPEGFIYHKRRFLWFWESRPVQWNEVNVIRAVLWDCFLAHAFGYRLILSESESVCMTDLDDDFDQFESTLVSNFPDIDDSVVKQVQIAFPEDVEMECWKNTNTQPEAAANLVNSVRCV